MSRAPPCSKTGHVPPMPQKLAAYQNPRLRLVFKVFYNKLNNPSTLGYFNDA